MLMIVFYALPVTSDHRGHGSIELCSRPHDHELETAPDMRNPAGLLEAARNASTKMTLFLRTHSRFLVRISQLPFAGGPAYLCILCGVHADLSKPCPVKSLT